MANNWYVITGGPSTGKSTLLIGLEKLGYKTVTEAARLVIDNGIAKGLTIKQIRADEAAFQEAVIRMKQEVESGLDKNILTFLDRGMQDTIAYMNYYGFSLEPWMNKLFESSKYQKVFLLEPLNNYVKDYARTENESFTKRMHTLLQSAYSDFGMEPVLVPAVSVEDRVKFVLERIRQEQPA